ncbi:hypothetical protein [Oribacterium sp. NK2B42]|uniref:hypothetical protein n=1 Tax=Oribacterium sp. NK2B42 TaxID=689781 RepID=UPI0005D28D5B|nr:hypothetical protein [Oribacterium sp. NK2B42]
MIFEFAMYYLSFLPLWISIIIIDIISIVRNDGNLWTERISVPAVIIGIIICLVVAYKWINEKGTQNRETYIIERAREERFVTAEFLMTYVLPLFAFEFTQWDGMMLFLLFFGIFWFLVYRHKYFCTNLALEICGYRVYECELKSGNQTIIKRVVSRKELDGMGGKTIRTRKFNNDYHFEVGRERGGES